MKRALAGGFLGALLFTVAVNIPHAYAQAVAPGGAAVDVLASLLGQDVAATRYTATATTGAGHVCNASIAACVDMPGANAQIGTNVSGDLLLGPENSSSVNVKVGPSIVLNGATGALVNTALDLYNSGYITNSVGGSVPIDDVYGLRITPKSLIDLPECGVQVNPGTLWVMTATVGDGASRPCFCQSDGAASPAYAWRNLASTLGTSTTCPAT